MSLLSSASPCIPPTAWNIVGKKRRHARTARPCPGTENEHRWPDPGEIVTFTAHIVNKGEAASPAVEFTWLIDGSTVTTGSLPGLAPAAAVTTTYTWPWAHGLVGERLTGSHTVGFHADPHSLVADPS